MRDHFSLFESACGAWIPSRVQVFGSRYAFGIPVVLYLHSTRYNGRKIPFLFVWDVTTFDDIGPQTRMQNC
jgi:hypothetical protein